MNVTINLPSEAEDVLRSRAEAAGLSAEDYALRLLAQQLGVAEHALPTDATPLRTISEEILSRVRALPDEAFEGLPTDGASQHDHYIYGTPKRDDL